MLIYYRATSLRLIKYSQIYSELEDVGSQIKQVLSRGIIHKALYASDDAQLVVELIRKIKFSIDKLTVVHFIRGGGLK